MHATTQSSFPNSSASDSNCTDDKKSWFQKEKQPSEPTVFPVSEKEKVCAEMLLSLKQDSDNEDSKEESPSLKEPEFTDKKTIKKPTKMKIRHKRCSNACSEHKRKHQRCPPECLGRKREEQFHQQAAQQQLNQLHQMQQAHFGLAAQRHSPTHSNQTTPPSSPIGTEQYLPISVMVPASFYRAPTQGNVLFYPMYPQQVALPAAPVIPPAPTPKASDEQLGSMISRFMTFPQDPRTALNSISPMTQYL